MDISENATILVRTVMYFGETDPHTCREDCREYFGCITEEQAVVEQDKFNTGQGEFSHPDVGVEFFCIETGAEIEAQYNVKSTGEDVFLGFDYVQGDEHDAAERQADIDAADAGFFD